MVVRDLRAADWPEVARIYVAGLAGGDASFETDAPRWEEWDADHLAEPRLVAEDDGAVTGWAALTPTSGRCVYGGVAEVSVYVDPAVHGRGTGRALLSALAERSESAGLWTLQAGVLVENTASLALHERCGFRVVGTRERIGRDAAGRWRDVVLLERRSTAVGL
jgi:L-amino acid N-acyltransferase YncA